MAHAAQSPSGTPLRFPACRRSPKRRSRRCAPTRRIPASAGRAAGRRWRAGGALPRRLPAAVRGARARARRRAALRRARARAHRGLASAARGRARGVRARCAARARAVAALNGRTELLALPSARPSGAARARRALAGAELGLVRGCARALRRLVGGGRGRALRDDDRGGDPGQGRGLDARHRRGAQHPLPRERRSRRARHARAPRAAPAARRGGERRRRLGAAARDAVLGLELHHGGRRRGRRRVLRALARGRRRGSSRTTACSRTPTTSSTRRWPPARPSSRPSGCRARARGWRRRSGRRRASWPTRSRCSATHVSEPQAICRHDEPPGRAGPAARRHRRVARHAPGRARVARGRRAALRVRVPRLRGLLGERRQRVRRQARAHLRRHDGQCARVAPRSRQPSRPVQLKRSVDDPPAGEREPRQAQRTPRASPRAGSWAASRADRDVLARTPARSAQPVRARRDHDLCAVRERPARRRRGRRRVRTGWPGRSWRASPGRRRRARRLRPASPSRASTSCIRH